MFYCESLIHYIICAHFCIQIALSLFNVACWALPLRSKEFSQNSVVLSRANVYAGGIFLMLSFSHLIPHALEELVSVPHGTTIALNCVLAGLLLMFFLEKVAFDSHAILHAHGNGEEDRVSSMGSQVTDASTTGRGSLSSRTALLLLLAMSLHSLFETVALGLATDRKSAAYMAASIGLHQPAESIALLIAFLKTSMPVSSIVQWLTLFSFVGPIGVACGVLIQRISTPLVQAVVVALTAGTFLYLGASEVLNEEFEGITTAEKWLRLILLLAGIGSIAVLDRIGRVWNN